MSDQEGDSDEVAQRFKALLLRLLKMPPQSRAELAAREGEEGYSDSREACQRGALCVRRITGHAGKFSES